MLQRSGRTREPTCALGSRNFVLRNALTVDVVCFEVWKRLASLLVNNALYADSTSKVVFRFLVSVIASRLPSAKAKVREALHRRVRRRFRIRAAYRLPTNKRTP